MKNKNYNQSADEIDLIETIFTVWEKKFSVILIILISFLIGVSYIKLSPNIYEGSIVIKPSEDKGFENFLMLNENIRSALVVDQKGIIKKFTNEFMDYQELIAILKKNKNIEEEIYQLSNVDKQKRLYAYAKRFHIQVPNSKAGILNYSIKYTWHELDEGGNILDQAVALTLKNVNKAIFEELNQSIDTKLNIEKNANVEEIIILTGQASIARELGIEDNQNPTQSLSKSSILFNINNETPPYYLRGYKAIELELVLLKNRQYEKFTRIKNEIKQFKEKDFDWIDYDIFLLEERLQKDLNFIIAGSILLGLMIALLYVFISNRYFQNQKLSHKE